MDPPLPLEKLLQTLKHVAVHKKRKGRAEPTAVGYRNNSTFLVSHIGIKCILYMVGKINFAQHKGRTSSALASGLGKLPNETD